MTKILMKREEEKNGKDGASERIRISRYIHKLEIIRRGKDMKRIFEGGGYNNNKTQHWERKKEIVKSRQTKSIRQKKKGGRRAV